ncbi:hypothetical protein BKA57DRAFT_453127 [Linnemannia elongata]|nr:hypothetical protein BKA57DRAFT_453127 [Linnemannia elongata]KAK5807824.1 hypothetical protein F5H01DRAFT_352700 [Linnemannia elongata]
MIVTAMVLSTFSSAALMISLIASSGPSSLINDLKQDDSDSDDYPGIDSNCTSSLRGFARRSRRRAQRRLAVDEAVELDDYFPSSP